MPLAEKKVNSARSGSATKEVGPCWDMYSSASGHGPRPVKKCTGRVLRPETKPSPRHEYRPGEARVNLGQPEIAHRLATVLQAPAWATLPQHALASEQTAYEAGADAAAPSAARHLGGLNIEWSRIELPTGGPARPSPAVPNLRRASKSSDGPRRNKERAGSATALQDTW